MTKKPVMIPFQTSSTQYLFDGVSSEIIPSSITIETIIRDYFQETKEDIKEKLPCISNLEFESAYQYVTALIEEGMFYRSEVEPKAKTGSIKEQIIDGSGSQLILVLTERCNMRCKYCVYSDQYPTEMNYSDKEMDFNLAKKAIDQYYAIHLEKTAHGYRKHPYVCFYGGEPLLKMPLIESAVAYAESLMPDVVFYITTNAVLLNDQAAEFFASHEFNITFSVDGYKENHDRNRVTSGGQTTFDSVFNNIRKFQELKKRTGRERFISINCCYDRYTDIYECICFFERHYDIFAPFYCTFAPVKPFQTTYYDSAKRYMEEKFPNVPETLFQDSLEKTRTDFFSKKKEKARFREIATSLFLGDYFFTLRSKWISSDYNHACTPLDKLAVYPDGSYGLCEKMNGNHTFGSVYNGIDWNKLEQIAAKFKYNFSSGKCSCCAIRTVCPACFMYMDNEGHIYSDFCEMQQRTFAEKLSRLYSLREQGFQIEDFITLNNDSMDTINVNK